MAEYRQIIGLLPSFTKNMESEQKFALWDSMTAAYHLGIKEGGQIMERCMKSGLENISVMASNE